MSKNFSTLINKRYEEIISFFDERKIEKSDNSVINVDDLYLGRKELDKKLRTYKTIELNEFDYLDNETKKKLDRKFWLIETISYNENINLKVSIKADLLNKIELLFLQYVKSLIFVFNWLCFEKLTIWIKKPNKKNKC